MSVGEFLCCHDTPVPLGDVAELVVCIKWNGFLSSHRIRNIFQEYASQGLLLIVPIVATAYMGVMFLFVLTTFFLTSFVDPGIFPRGMHGRVLPPLSLSPALVHV